jgi:hypothetical protein
MWACFAVCVIVKLASVGPSAADETRDRQLGLDMAKPWTGDLDVMVKRRLVRILAPYSKTSRAY